VRQQQSDGARREATQDWGGPAGQDDGHASAEYDARSCRVGEILQLLREHVSCLKIRHEQNVRLTRDRRNNRTAASSTALTGPMTL
jgi:hypothetical protein